MNLYCFFEVFLSSKEAMLLEDNDVCKKEIFREEHSFTKGSLIWYLLSFSSLLLLAISSYYISNSWWKIVPYSCVVIHWFLQNFLFLIPSITKKIQFGLLFITDTITPDLQKWTRLKVLTGRCVSFCLIIIQYLNMRSIIVQLT